MNVKRCSRPDFAAAFMQVRFKLIFGCFASVVIFSGLARIHGTTYMKAVENSGGESAE